MPIYAGARSAACARAWATGPGRATGDERRRALPAECVARVEKRAARRARGRQRRGAWDAGLPTGLVLGRAARGDHQGRSVAGRMVTIEYRIGISRQQLPTGSAPDLVPRPRRADLVGATDPRFSFLRRLPQGRCPRNRCRSIGGVEPNPSIMPMKPRMRQLLSAGTDDLEVHR